MNELENRIEDFAKKFDGENIEIEFDNFLKGKISFYNTDIKYDKGSGFVKLQGQDANLEFNALDVNYIDYRNDRLEIHLDNSLIISIIRK